MNPGKPTRWPRRRFLQQAALMGGALSLQHAWLWAWPRAAAADFNKNVIRRTQRDFILLNSNENPYLPPAKLLEALRDASVYAARYPDNSNAELTRAIAALHGVDPSMIVLGCGSTEILKMTDDVFLAGGKKLIVAEPTFEDAVYYSQASRAEVVKLPLTKNFEHPLEEMLATCDEKTGLVYLCNPNNPTGTLTPKAKIEKFLERVPSHVAVIIDEAYHHYADSPDYKSFLDAVRGPKNVIIARTFSKVYGMAGLRLGYAVAKPETVQLLRARRLINNANIVAANAALALLPEAEWVKENIRRNRSVKEKLYADLKQMGLEYIPTHANFVMIHVRRDVRPIIAAIRERGILVGRPFAAMPDYLRVSFGTPDEMDQFSVAFKAAMAA